MLKGQNGITLVALVITIIVLLILASVTISLTLGQNGLFNLSKNAGKNYMNAQKNEMQALNYLTDNTIPDLLNDLD